MRGRDKGIERDERRKAEKRECGNSHGAKALLFFLHASAFQTMRSLLIFVYRDNLAPNVTLLLSGI